MMWKDRNGKLLQYGDYVEDVEKRFIGYITRSQVNDTPVIHIVKQFSFTTLEYVNVGNASAAACYERAFLPSWGRIRKWYCGYCLPTIELIHHGARNYRAKEF